MNELLKILLSLSLSGTLLLLILFFCKYVLKEKCSKRWQYYIWLVVIARLLLPFAPEANLVGTLFQNYSVETVQADTGAQPLKNLSEPLETGFSVSNALSDNQPAIHSDGAESPATPYIQNIALVWLIVAIVLLVRKITIYQSFVRYIKAGRVEVSDIEALERFGKLVEQMGIRRGVAFYTHSLISSPLLIGFFRPCIVLPTMNLSDSDFKYTILHELTHYKRLDMFYKWLVQITICLHWFNPAVYFMAREINRACELSCDEAVIRKLDAENIRAYGNTLLNAISMGGDFKESLASVTLNESKILLKERLDSIMTFKKKSKLVIALTLALTFLLCAGAVVAGAYMPPDKARIWNNDGWKDSLAQSFEPYKIYGVTYDKNLDAVFYNGRRVRGFADIQEIYPDGGFSYHLHFTDDESNSSLYLQAVRDSQDRLTGVKEVPKERVGDLFYTHDTTFAEALSGAGLAAKITNNITNEITSNITSEIVERTAKGIINGIFGIDDDDYDYDYDFPYNSAFEAAIRKEIEENMRDIDFDEIEKEIALAKQTARGALDTMFPITYKATLYLADGITATDNFDSTDLPQNIISWIHALEKTDHAVVKRSTANGTIDAWVYYNSGHRLAWNMEADGTTLKLYLMDAAPAFEAGPTVIHYQAPAAYNQLRVFYEGRELTIDMQ